MHLVKHEQFVVVRSPRFIRGVGEQTSSNIRLVRIAPSHVVTGEAAVWATAVATVTTAKRSWVT